MTRREHRALQGAVLSLAASMLLLEVLAFRLCAATLGAGFAVFVGLVVPAAAALGGALLARRSPARSVARMARSAAHMAALGGGAMATAAIAITWISQSVATALGEGSYTDVAVTLLAWSLPAMLIGASLALCLRIGVPTIGRLGFAEGLGGALTALLLPAILGFSAPRAMLASGFIVAIAAFLLAYVGRSKRPRWATLATLPLAVASLLAGDIGAPWMKVRIDTGRRSSIDFTYWTTQGVVSIQKISRDRARFRYDRSIMIPLAEELKGSRKPQVRGQDLLYFLNEKAEGPVLVIGTSGGYELSAALAYGHDHVDGIALEGAFLNHVLADERYAAISGNLLADERLNLRIGSGRRLPGGPNDKYQRIIVNADVIPLQIGPRLLTTQRRLFSRESLRALLERLQPHGGLLMRVPRSWLPSIMTTASEAVGGAPQHARQHLFSCASRGTAVVVVQRERLDPRHIQNLTKRCKKSRLTIEYPIEKPRKGHRNSERLDKERQDQQAELWRGTVVTDALPFLSSPPAATALRSAALASLRALRPINDAAPKPKADKDAAGETESAAEPRSEMTPWGIAAAGLALALLVLLITLLIPPGKPAPGRPAAPLTLRLSFPAFGAALALCIFALTDQLLVAFDNAGFAWSLLIPMSFIGVGCGRLWVDSLRMSSLWRAPLIALVIGVAWLVAMHAGGRVALDMFSHSAAVSLTMVFPLVLVSGWLLGAPLAWGLRLVGSVQPAAITSCWSAHHAGWTVGGAAAALAVFYLGVGRLMPLGIVAYALGAMLFVAGGRKAFVKAGG